jgi:hypothetical protein
MSVTAKVLIQSKYAANTNTTEYTAPALTRTIIDKFTATNNDASARTISIYIVPSAGSADGSNRIIKDLSIAAGVTADISEMQNQILATGDFVVCAASVTSQVTIRMSGREVT